MREPKYIKIINERRKLTHETTEIKRIIRRYSEQLYLNILDNLGVMDKFLKTYNLSKLNLGDSEYLNVTIITNKVKAVIRKLPVNKSLQEDDYIYHIETDNSIVTARWKGVWG